MALTTWSAEMLLGVPEMDEAHEAFVALLNQVAEAKDDEFVAAYRGLVAHIERDFREEETLMESIDYPGIRSHREQHARVLASLHQAVPEVMNGNLAMGRKAMEMLPNWFMFHLATMDTALSFALDVKDRQPEAFPDQIAM